MTVVGIHTVNALRGMPEAFVIQLTSWGNPRKRAQERRVMMSARPLNLAERHVAPKTPLHRNDSTIESQSLHLPATSNPSVYIIAVLGSARDAVMHTVQATRPVMHVTNAPIRQAS
jgi:hypothetical protein